MAKADGVVLGPSMGNDELKSHYRKLVWKTIPTN